MIRELKVTIPGLFQKYIVKRVDKKPIDWCFVLELKDPAARAALRTYSLAVCPTNPTLSTEIWERVRAYEAKDEASKKVKT